MQDPVSIDPRRKLRKSPFAKSAPSSDKASRDKANAKKGSRRVKKPGKEVYRVVKVGFHFGDCRTKVVASKNGERVNLKKEVFTNIVGFLKIKSPFARIPEKSDVLYADQAVKFLRQVDLKRPIHLGLVTDVKVCRQFITHVCSTIDPSGSGRLWGVVSIPASAGFEEADKVHRSLSGLFERVVVVPEPYLAAEGMHLEKGTRRARLGEDLTLHSLVIDIGAATTDLCLVRGPFPGPADCLRSEKGGNFIDEKILKNSLVHSPTLFLNYRMVREIKEEQAFVGGSHEVSKESSSDLIAFTEVIRTACEELLQTIVDGACELLGRCDPTAARDISRNIILTGGGSRIRSLPESLEERLRSRGYAEASVLVPEEYKDLVARGALRFAEKLSDDDWKALSSRSPAQNAEQFEESWLAGAPAAEAAQPGRTGEPEESGEPVEAAASEAAPPEEGGQPEEESEEHSSISWMNVKLRDEVHSEQPAAGEAGAPAAAAARARAQAAAAAEAAQEEKKKKKEQDFTLEDMEELELFKGL